MLYVVTLTGLTIAHVKLDILEMGKVAMVCCLCVLLNVLMICCVHVFSLIITWIDKKDINVEWIDVYMYLTIDVDECSSNSHSCTDVNAVCINTRGSYTCTCKAGYTRDGRACRGELPDRNEFFTAPYNNMRTLKFKTQPPKTIFATLNQRFGGSSQLSTTAESAIIKSSRWFLVLHCASLLRTISSSLARARTRRKKFPSS